MEDILKICSCNTTIPTIPSRHQANIKLTRNSAWIRLGIDKHDTPILIDTGAGINLLRQDIVELWVKHHADKMSIKQESIAAETCGGSPLEITGKVIISPGHLSGGPQLPSTDTPNQRPCNPPSTTPIPNFPTPSIPILPPNLPPSQWPPPRGVNDTHLAQGVHRVLPGELPGGRETRRRGEPQSGRNGHITDLALECIDNFKNMMAPQRLT